MPDRHSQQENEAASISAVCSRAVESWRFLPPAVENRLKAIADGLSLKGYERTNVEMHYLPNDSLLTSISFSPQPGTESPPTKERCSELMSGAAPQLSDLKKLRQEQFLASTNVSINIVDNREVRVDVLSFGGIRAASGQRRHFEPGVAGREDRAAIWQEVFGDLELITRVPEGSAAKARAVARLEKLRDAYEIAGDRLLANTCQALIVWTDPDVYTVRKYADLGKIEDNQLNLVPDQFREKIAFVNELTKNVPLSSYFAVLEYRTNGVEKSSWLDYAADLGA